MVPGSLVRLGRVWAVEPGRLHKELCWGCGVHACKDGVDFGALRGEVTDGIGGGGVSREQESLAAAAAEVLLAAVAGLAGFLHPNFSAEFLEGGGVFPDFTEGAVLHVFKSEAGNDLRGVAGKRVAVRCDEHQLAAPAAHAGLGIFGVVVWDYIFDSNLVLKAFLSALNECERLVQLCAGGEKVFAVGESPAVILDVGELDARGAGRFGDGEHFFQLIDVAAVDDEVEGDGDAVLLEPIENAEFLRVGFCAGDFVGGFFAGALEAELNVIEPGGYQRGEFCFIEREAGGDEVDVEAGGTGGADEFDDIGTGERLAAGEVGLEDAELGGFVEDAGPDFGGEFVRTGLHFEGIGAVDAVQGAAVG